MKILYISPQHISGTLDLWQREHRRRGNECRFVTLFPSAYDYTEDICLHLPLHPDNRWIRDTRRFIQRITRGVLADDTPITERPPCQPRPGFIEDLFFRIRDATISSSVETAIRQYDLSSYDIIHLDQGQGFFRDARVIRRWHSEGKKIIAFYHGSDLRNRGIFRNIDKLVHLRLTCEVDLMQLDPRLEYLFLPFDTSRWTPVPPLPGNKKLKIVHTARVRAFKGTDYIIEVVRDLEKSYPVELVLLENVPHAEAMAIKSHCDIAVDQIADTGGWGYGMSGVEYLSLGIPTCTSMIPEMVEFIPDHPFVPVTRETLKDELIRLIEDEKLRREIGEAGREWVVKRHDIQAVGDRLYAYYEREGWLKLNRI